MIFYFNDKYFQHPTIQQAILKECGPDTLSNLLNLVKYDPACPPVYNRKGSNLLPFKTDLINMSDFSMPDYNPNFDKSWADVTDQRCMDLRNTHFDRPWKVLWSGGIDSTNLVASMIKNLPPADLDNITIACTPVCIWENPHFYFDYIKPNFKVADSLEILSQDFDSQDAYIVDGEPADQLFGGLGVALNILYQNFDWLHQDITKNNKVAIDFISQKTDRKFAEWYYHVMVTSAQSAGVPVTTLHDLAWWSNFNTSWITVRFRSLLHNAANCTNVKNVKSYLEKFVHWYNNDDYQQWAMNPKNSSEKLGSGLSEYKLAAKKYIYSVDNNKYYFKFKTKLGSSDIWRKNLNNWCCVTDNWDTLYIEHDAEQIVSLLPDHLR
jgi:hypothetical protein